MDIKVGDFIRTKTGYIGKVENINDFRPPEAKICVDFNVSDLIFLGETDIIKHSPNIIDLIEVGDYVNGKRVVDVATIENKYDEEELCVFVEETQDCIESQDIKSIVTKEMMKNVMYEVK